MKVSVVKKNKIISQTGLDKIDILLPAKVVLHLEELLFFSFPVHQTSKSEPTFLLMFNSFESKTTPWMIFFGYAQTPWNRVHATRGGRVLADVEAKREQLRTRATEATKEVVGMGGSKSHFTVKCVICNLSEFEAGCQGSGMVGIFT